MARSLKVNGLQELAALERRVRRQFALGRIKAADETYLIERINEIQERIVGMQEFDEQGEEVDKGWP